MLRGDDTVIVSSSTTHPATINGNGGMDIDLIDGGTGNNEIIEEIARARASSLRAAKLARS